MGIYKLIFSFMKVYSIGKRKTSTAIAKCERGEGIYKIQGIPLTAITPNMLRLKIKEPIKICGESLSSQININSKVKGGGQVSRVFAVRQAIAKSIVSFCEKNSSFASTHSLKKLLLAFDKTMIIPDYRLCEPKKKVECLQEQGFKSHIGEKFHRFLLNANK